MKTTTNTDMYDDWLSRFEAQERRDAEEAGMSLDAYRTHVDTKHAEEEAQRKAKESRNRRAALLAPMRRHMSDDGYWSIVENTEKPSPALDSIKGWLRANNSPPLMILSGGTGCGKTVAAAWGVARTHRAQYAHARTLGAQFMPYSHDEARGIEALDLGTGLLVVDDLGTERRSSGGPAADDRFTEALSTILDTRQHASDKTIMITNLTPERFVETYCRDPRDKSRLTAIAIFCKAGRKDLRAACEAGAT